MTPSMPDQALADLTAAKRRWAGLSIADKVGYLERLRPLVRDGAAEWVYAAVGAKGIPAGSPLAGEEWISGPYAVLSWIAAAIETLDAVASGDNPLKGFALSPRPPWFVTNRTADVTGRRLTYYAADGKLRHLPGILASALRG